MYLRLRIKKYYKWLNRKVPKYEYKRIKYFLNGKNVKDTTIKAIEYIMTKEKINYYEIYDIKKIIKKIKKEYKGKNHFVYHYVRKLRTYL